MNSEAEARYRLIRRIAVLMNGAFRLPGTRFRFGLNSVVGLPPAAGDAVLAIVSLWIVWQASALGLPRTKLIRMVGNIMVEAVLGSVPVLGDLMDVAWKANLRNLKIIDDHLDPLGLRESFLPLGPATVGMKEQAAVSALHHV
jgi:hypothetical protein